MTHRQGFPYRRSRRLRPKDREQSENWMTPALSRRSSSGLNTSGITAPFYAYIIGSVKVADSTGSSDPPISSEDVPGVPVLFPVCSHSCPMDSLSSQCSAVLEWPLRP
jgi:hypothetical protein